jgi:hypothetical protein
LADLFGTEVNTRVTGDGLPVSLAVQDVSVVIEPVGPIGLFERLLLDSRNAQQVAMRLRVGRTTENFTIVEDNGF